MIRRILVATAGQLLALARQELTAFEHISVGAARHSGRRAEGNHPWRPGAEFWRRQPRISLLFGATIENAGAGVDGFELGEGI